MNNFLIRVETLKWEYSYIVQRWEYIWGDIKIPKNKEFFKKIGWISKIKNFSILSDYSKDIDIIKLSSLIQYIWFWNKLYNINKFDLDNPEIIEKLKNFYEKGELIIMLKRKLSQKKLGELFNLKLGIFLSWEWEYFKDILKKNFTKEDLESLIKEYYSIEWFISLLKDNKISYTELWDDVVFIPYWGKSIFTQSQLKSKIKVIPVDTDKYIFNTHNIKIGDEYKKKVYHKWEIYPEKDGEYVINILKNIKTTTEEKVKHFMEYFLKNNFSKNEEKKIRKKILLYKKVYKKYLYKKANDIELHYEVKDLEEINLMNLLGKRIWKAWEIIRKNRDIFKTAEVLLDDLSDINLEDKWEVKKIINEIREDVINGKEGKLLNILIKYK